jgi:DNA-3-methyladenine glycosylase II
MPMSLDEDALARGLSYLSARDPDLARVLDEFGPPPMWERETGFPTLLRIILEQKISLASAGAVYDRLEAIRRPLTPERFLELDDATLKTIGFSRRKIDYVRDLACFIIEGRLDLSALDGMEDEAARAELFKIKGIGPWTADIYLLRALLRPDVWPRGDLALAVAAQRVKGLTSYPGPEELDALGALWKPWRAVAARLLWHYYLNRKRV